MKSLLRFCLLLGWLSSAVVEESHAQVFTDQFMVLDEKIGLPDENVQAITFDLAGFLWIATPKGLCRFDGSDLKLFQHQLGDTTSLPNNQVTNVQLDQQGRLWVSTAKGLALYQPHTQTFQNFLADPTHPHSLPSHRIFGVYQDRQQNLWIGSENGGLIRYHEAEARFVTTPIEVAPADTTVDLSRINSVLAIAPDPDQDDMLWLATLSGLVKHNKRTQQSEVFLQPTHQENYLLNACRVVLPLSNQRLMIGTWDGAVLFDIPSQRFIPVQPADEHPTRKMSHRMVRSMVHLPDGKVGINYSIGYAVYDPDQRQVLTQYYNRPGQVYGREVVDAQNRVWASSQTGVYLYNPLNAQFPKYTFPVAIDHFTHQVRAVIESQDRQQLYFCVFNSEGLPILDRATGTWQRVNPPPSALSVEGNFLATDMIRLHDGRIVLCTESELWLFDEQRRMIKSFLAHLDFGKPNFRRMLQDRNGHLWIGSRRLGLYRIDLSTGTYQTYREELNTAYHQTRHQWIETLYEDRLGQIWIRTAADYSVYLPDEDRFINIESPNTDYTRAFNNIHGFVAGTGDTMLVVDLENGLGMASMQQPERGVIQRVATPKTLRNQSFWAIAKDANDHIWLDCQDGLMSFDPHTRQQQYYGRIYGAPQSNQEFIGRLSTGEMIVGQQQGCSIFRPENLTTNAELPIPYLSSLQALNDTFIEGILTEQVSLHHRQNFFSFEFSALAYNVPEQVQYAYQLEGVDEDWNYAGTRKYAAYTNIAGGSYVFKIKAANNEGRWNDDIYTLKIDIAVPWWKTNWFWGILIAILLGLGVVIFRWRVWQIRQQEALKTKFEKKLANVELNALRAQMNPHFIFNCLNSIDCFILKNDSYAASDYLNRFSRLIRLILQNSRSDYVNLKDELEALKLYIEMESLRFEKKFDYIVRIDKQLCLEDYDVPPMLLQPYVENAIWHGLVQKTVGRGRVELTITKANGHLRCLIEDNGIGRAAARKLRSKNATRYKSMGLNITNDRIAMINKLYQTNASVRIIDLKDNQGNGTGTRVELHLPC